MFCPQIVVWNCRGAGSAIFLRHLFLLVRKYSCSILVLLETRVNSSYINSNLAKSCFTYFIVSEAIGFSGGIWVLWNSLDVQVEAIFVDPQVINCLVSHNTQHPWLLSILYATPNSVWHTCLWEYLARLGEGLKFPWLLTGDFNQITDSHEKRGDSLVCVNSSI